MGELELRTVAAQHHLDQGTTPRSRLERVSEQDVVIVPVPKPAMAADDSAHRSGTDG
jgi:hypothetical protein